MTTVVTKGAKGLTREIRARFTKGKIAPLEEVDLKEGDEVRVIIPESPSPAAKDAFEKAAGGWKGLVDTDALLRDFKKSREIIGPEVQL
jgi:predicted DNA-binding antitoxin AbrB/MazE fold protein